MFAAVLALTGAANDPAEDGDGPAATSTATSDPPADPSSEMIPEPNSGQEPQEAGDRGSGLQLGLLALIVVALGGIVAKLRRESRQARASSRS